MLSVLSIIFKNEFIMKFNWTIQLIVQYTSKISYNSNCIFKCIGKVKPTANYSTER